MKLKLSFLLPASNFGISSSALLFSMSAFAEPAGCPTGVLTTGNQTIVCSTDASISTPQTSNTAIGTYSTSSPPPSGSPSLTSDAYDGINLTVNQYTTITTSASPIGLASSSSVVNNGNLSSNLFNGYGISFGVNGRSQNGGNSATNSLTGQITTSLTNSDGIRISATKVGSAGNTVINYGSILTVGNDSSGISVASSATGSSILNSITNAGRITTAGSNAYGLELNSRSGLNSISNSISGRINTTGSSADGIHVTNAVGTTINNAGIINVTGSAANSITIMNGVANITNSGTLNSSSGLSVQFSGTVPVGSFNSLTIENGSSMNAGISFNKASIQETLSFSGYNNGNFDNPVTGLNIINVASSSNVVMSNALGYELVGGEINVDSNSSLTISSAIVDQTSPTVVSSSINKIGAGALTLTGANTYTGGTTVSAGSLIGNSTSLQGTIANNTDVIFNQTSAGTYAGIMSGTGTLEKIGAGALTLTGANTYTGGTTVSAGSLIGNSTSLQGTIANNADVIFNQTSAGTYAGIMSGTGTLEKIGPGALTLTGTNTYTGGTTVSAGVLNLTGSVSSNVLVNPNTTLSGSGFINGNLINAGNISPAIFFSNATNLTINGNYVGNDGNFNTNIYGPNLTPTADTLTISGLNNTASGSTGINVVDKGGLGNLTNGNGIQVVALINSATSTSSAFVLNDRVASGAIQYYLYKGTETNPSDDNWYLRTASTQVPETTIPAPPNTTTPPITPGISQRIEVAVYPALPSLIQLYAQTAVDTLDQRRGDLNLANPQGIKKTSTNEWARVIGKTGTSSPSQINDGPKLSFNAYALQFGIDLFKSEQHNGSRTYAGPFFTIGGANGNTSNQAGTSSTGNLNGMQAYSFGLYGTHFAENGLYFDALVQGTRYLNAEASSVQGASVKTQGTGFTGSFEMGVRWNVNEKFLISPQAQIVYDANSMNNASDAYGQINFNKSEIARGRLGLLAGHKDVVGNTPVFTYIRASYWNVFNAGTSTTFESLYGVNPVTFKSQTGSGWLALDAEINASLTESTNLFLNLGWDNSLVGTYQAFSGRIGLTMSF